MSNPDYKNILFQLCASLTQVDYMGAAWEQVETALREAGIDIGEQGGKDQIAKVLGEMGITTFNGSSLTAGYEPYY